MKKLLCFLGILVLLFLAFLPPVLRIILKEEDEVEKPQITKKVVLSCNSDNYMVSTNYENDNVKMIVLKKKLVNNVQNNSEEDIEQDTTISLETELDKTFKSLTTSNNIIYNVLEDGEVVGIDFSIYGHADLNITNLTKSPENQKSYYESQGLTCVIRE